MADPRGSSHLDQAGRARMVDVGDKDVTDREATASGAVRMKPETLALLRGGGAPKGDVLAAARIAGIQAAKRTPELIPLCHHVALTGCEVSFDAGEDRLRIAASARARDRTGVEMEALTAVAVAALTVYDMLKSVDRDMSIEEVMLQSKRGGRTGEYRR